MKKQNDDSSDSDDPDFVVEAEEDVSDHSVQSGDEESEENDDEPKETKRKKLKSNHESLKDSREQNPEEETLRTDSLWKSFLNDTATSSKVKNDNSSTKSFSKNDDIITKSDNKEENTSSGSKSPLSSEVSQSSSKILQASSSRQVNKNSSPLSSTVKSFKKRGLSDILKSTSKVPKTTILEKSKQDWNQFKEANNISEELSVFNRGKNGYLEKQDFLRRTDLRQFEIEKDLRNVGKRKL